MDLRGSILHGQGRGLEAGDHGVWTFLFKTADLIEQGVRQVLVAGLPSVAITKQGMLLRPSSLSLTPDLRFGTDMAVGDVKYKLTGMDWNRNDLYQAVTFGTGFGCSKVAVIAFRTTASLELPRVRVGNVEVVPFCWNCSDAVPPEEAGSTLCSEVEAWLTLEATEMVPA